VIYLFNSFFKNDLEVPQYKRDEMMKNYSSQTKWTFVLEHQVKSDNAVKKKENCLLF
jgi:hypothetical protein